MGFWDGETYSRDFVVPRLWGDWLDPTWYLGQSGPGLAAVSDHHVAVTERQVADHEP